MNITTSISTELYNLAKEKHLKWNECLIAGIKVLTNIYIPPATGETIVEESAISRLTKQRNALQNALNIMEDELNAVQEQRKKDNQ